MEPRPHAVADAGWRQPEAAPRPVKALSPTEAAKVLRTSPENVRALLRSGRLAGVEVTPRRWKTTEAACQRFLEGMGER